MPKNLGELLTLNAKRYPRRNAIIFGSKKISYKALDDSTDRIAAGLIRLGVKKQQRVAIFLDNCPEFVLSYFAVLKSGAVAVPINYMFKIEEARYILEDCQAVGLITSRASLEMAEELRLRVDSLKHIIAAKSDGTVPDLNNIESSDTASLKNVSIAPEEPAVVVYTSGTTGFPKGAVLSHHNLISNARDCIAAIKTRAGDCFICILPLFHSFAATVCMNLPLLAGARIVIMKSVAPFKRVMRAVRNNRVSIFVAVPSVYNILAEIKLPRILGTPLLKLFNPVKICISGAAALPVETFRAFEKKFRLPLLEGYGLTEASPVVTLNPLKGGRKAGSIGLALSPNIALKIVDDNGNALGPHKAGELLVKGPNVMQGYYKQEEATRQTLKDGWLYTGDMAECDSDGYFYIVGRKKEMINVRGLNVYPREIEEGLYRNPKVKEAAVIGIKDPHKGEVPKAFVVLKEGESATEHEILQYLREMFAPYKVPKYVELKKSLPKNSTGKILKRLLV